MYNQSTGRFEEITLSFAGEFHLVGHGKMAVWHSKTYWMTKVSEGSCLA